MSVKYGNAYGMTPTPVVVVQERHHHHTKETEVTDMLIGRMVWDTSLFYGAKGDTRFPFMIVGVFPVADHLKLLLCDSKGQLKTRRVTWEYNEYFELALSDAERSAIRTAEETARKQNDESDTRVHNSKERAKRRIVQKTAAKIIAQKMGKRKKEQRNEKETGA